jgi:hypothetical protein
VFPYLGYSAGCGRKVPRRSARSFIKSEEHRNQNQDVNGDKLNPPTMEAAIGFIASEPMAVPQRMESNWRQLQKGC